MISDKTMNFKVERDKNRVDITKKDSLLEMDNYVDAYQFVSTISNHKFTIKYPDLDDATDEEVAESIQSNKELIDNLEEKIYDQNVSYEELSEIIDLESFAKAYWVFEISENYDAMYGSSYIYTKDNLDGYLSYLKGKVFISKLSEKEEEILQGLWYDTLFTDSISAHLIFNTEHHLTFK